MAQRFHDYLTKDGTQFSIDRGLLSNASTVFFSMFILLMNRISAAQLMLHPVDIQLMKSDMARDKEIIRTDLPNMHRQNMLSDKP
jgi:hypothetical protein